MTTVVAADARPPRGKAKGHQLARLVGLRLILLIPVLLGTSMIVFAVGRIALANPSISALSVYALPAAKAAFIAHAHLNVSLPAQYLLWLGDVLRGDLGTSLVTGAPVASMISAGFGVTLQLALGALVIVVCLGFGLGTVAGLRSGSMLGRSIGRFALLGVSVPAFWLGLVLIYVFALQWTVFSASGSTSMAGGLGDYVRHMALPWITLALAPAGLLARVVQVRVAEEARRPHVTTARSLGVSQSRIIRHYILRNALLEPTTVLGIQVGYLLGGVVLVELVFNLPGLGQIALTAARQGDYPVVQAVTLVAAVIFVAANLAVDLLHYVLDVRSSK